MKLLIRELLTLLIPILNLEQGLAIRDGKLGDLRTSVKKPSHAL
jgi:hypothetical protein